MKFSSEDLIFVGKTTLKCYETHIQIVRNGISVKNNLFKNEKEKNFYLEEPKLAGIEEDKEEDYKRRKCVLHRRKLVFL